MAEKISPLRLLSRVSTFLWRQKYFWAIAIFVVFAGFVDDNSYRRYLELRTENEATQREIEHYEALFERYNTRLHQLQSDPDALLHVAREDHQMKSDDEDVYYIVEPSKPDTIATHPQ